MPTHRSIPMLALFAAAACHAHADTAVFLTTDLSIGSGEIIAITEDTLTLMDPSGATERIPMDRISRIDASVIPATATERPGLRFVELTDGQRLAIEITDSPDPDALAGRSPALGRVTIPLERVRSISGDQPSDTPRDIRQDTDHVTLTNGDVLAGFVAAMGTEITIESDNGVLNTIELARVRSVRLANPADEPARVSVLVHDSLGNALLARSFSVAPDGSLSVQADAAPLGLASNGEDRIEYQPDATRFVALSVRRPDARVIPLVNLMADPARATGDRRWTPSPEALTNATPPHIPDLFMPAPASVRYEIPRGAYRFAAELAHRGGPWTDCVASIHAELRDGTLVTLGTQPIDAATRPGDQIGSIHADLPENTRALIFEVDPGAYGAVQDAVVFSRPRLRVRD